MRSDEILSKVQFVTDPITGERSAVLIDYDVWKELLTLLEGMEEGNDTGFKSSDKSLRPFGLCAGEFTVPDDFDSPLPDYVIEDFQGRS